MNSGAVVKSLTILQKDIEICLVGRGSLISTLRVRGASQSHAALLDIGVEVV